MLCREMGEEMTIPGSVGFPVSTLFEISEIMQLVASRRLIGTRALFEGKPMQVAEYQDLDKVICHGACC